MQLCDSPVGQSKWSDGEDEYSSNNDVGGTGLHQLASAAANASAASKDQQQQQQSSELQQLALIGSSTGSAGGGESEGVSLRQLR
jgi:hypothetical protein